MTQRLDGLRSDVRLAVRQFVSVLVVTLLTASVAAAAPAWRASRIDPATAFRHDG